MIRKKDKEEIDAFPLTLLILLMSLLFILFSMLINRFEERKYSDENCIYWELTYVTRGRFEHQLMCNNNKIIKNGKILDLPLFYESMKDSIDLRYKKLLEELPKK